MGVFNSSIGLILAIGLGLLVVGALYAMFVGQIGLTGDTAGDQQQGANKQLCQQDVNLWCLGGERSDWRKFYDTYPGCKKFNDTLQITCVE
jgi:hypothetical protein